MQISDIRIKKNPHGPHIGWLSFMYNEEIWCSSIQIFRIPSGKYILRFPGKTLPDGKTFFTYVPKGKKELQDVYDAVIEDIRREFGPEGQEDSAESNPW